MLKHLSDNQFLIASILAGGIAGGSLGSVIIFILFGFRPLLPLICLCVGLLFFTSMVREAIRRDKLS